MGSSLHLWGGARLRRNSIIDFPIISLKLSSDSILNCTFLFNPFGPIMNKYCACALTKLIPRGSRFTGSVCVRECNQHENARDVSRKIPSDF